MSGLSVSVLGPPLLVQDGAFLKIEERKAIALLAYLAVSGASHSRDALATMFWPEQSQSRARASLRHAMWSLRVAGLGENLAIEDDRIRMVSSYGLDVIEFNQLLEEHWQHGHASGEVCPVCLPSLLDAVSLYKGDFLAGFTLRDSPQFDEWQYFQREHWKELFAYALGCLVRWHVRTGDWARAIEYARRWVVLDPLHEPAQRWLMRAYAGNGKRSMALRQYAALRKMLDKELGIAPEAETSDLAKTLRSNKLDGKALELSLFQEESHEPVTLERQPVPKDKFGGSGDPLRYMRAKRTIDSSLLARNKPTPSPARFLERAAFIERLEELLAKARLGEGRMVFLGAEAGGGKTTLIRHFCTSAPKTVRVVIGICDPLSAPPPLGPLWDIAAEMEGNLLHLIRAGEKPEWIFRAFLEQLRRGHTIHIVVFEDVHWSDEATLDLLRFIGRRIESTHALVIASFREDEVEGQHPLRILLGDLATAAGIERLHLPPLTRQAVGLLVAGSRLDPDELYRKTGGNPFFITEMLASGTDRIPDSVRDAVLVRAAHLAPSARSVLDSAAVLGTHSEATLVMKMTGEGAAAIDECVHAGMLLARVDGMEFRHELARQAVLEALSPLRLQFLHRQALEALRGLATDAADLARLAYHAEEAADAQAVLEYAPAAARQAIAAGAHRQAAIQYERALRFASGMPAKERAQLLTDYSRECSRCDMNNDELRALEEARQIWHENGDLVKEGDNFGRLASCLYFLGRYAEANQAIHTAIKILSEFPSSIELAYAYNQYANILAFNSDYEAAISIAKKAIDLGERFKDAHILVRGHNTIGISLTYIGEASGRDQLEKSITLARQARDYVGVALGYCNLSRWSGLMYGWDAADQYIASGLAHCAEFDMDSHNSFLLASQASALLYQGHWSEAESTAKFVLSRQYFSLDTRFWALVELGRVLTRRGDPGSSSALDEALEIAEKFGILMYLAPARVAQAEAAWLAGRPECIQEEVRSIYDLAVAKHHIWYAGELGLWLWRAGARFDLPDWAMPVHASQIRGDWAAAAAEWQRRRQPYERAWALVDGDVEARLTALEIFDRLGAAPAAAALRRELRSQGIHNLPRKPRSETRQKLL